MYLSSFGTLVPFLYMYVERALLFKDKSSLCPIEMIAMIASTCSSFGCVLLDAYYFEIRRASQRCVGNLRIKI